MNEQRPSKQELHWANPAAALRDLSSASIVPPGLTPLMIQSADEIERLQQRVAEQTARGDQLNRELSAFLKVGRAQPPSVPAVTALDQYRCQPEKQVYCPHMDLTHTLLAEWLKAWDAGADKSLSLYERTRVFLRGRASQPPNESLTIIADLLATIDRVADKWKLTDHGCAACVPGTEGDWLCARHRAASYIYRTAATKHERCDDYPKCITCGPDEKPGSES